MLILGLSSPYKNDASVALMRDGKLEAAIENYKIQPAAFNNIPEAAVEYCLAKGGITWGDIDVVAIANDPFRGWMRRAFSHRRLSLLAPVATIYQQGKELNRLAKEWTGIRILRRRLRNEQKLVSLNHHSCHAASAFFLSAFDKALICTLDGEGDGLCGLLAVGDGCQIRVQNTISYSNSIGWLYSRMTDLIGFRHSRDEHKTQWQGLQGEPIYKDVFLRILRRPGEVFPRLDLHYFRRDLTGGFVPSRFLFDQLGLSCERSELTAEQKRDIAKSVQVAITEVVSDLLVSFQRKFGIAKICLGGGVFQNVLLVSSLEQKFGMGNIFVPPAPGNAGCAVGAAAWIWHQQMSKPRQPEIRSVYLGPSFVRQEIKDALDNVKASYSLHNGDESMLATAVQLLRAGKIIGWFQGAAEFGPRALGHRSILASPWAPFVTENINDYVKHRESFRPFAVSVCEEDCDKYFEASSLCRFMNSLGIVRSDRDILPQALQLMGGLIRLHLVEKQTNRLLWELLKRFGEYEEAPILVNTSFNLYDEPSVVRPRDAIRTFFCSGTEAVFIDRFLLTKWSAAYILNGRSVPRPKLQERT
ncbi:MAG: carbamoyltransferase C-terminal domain-containing protein [Terracidiphilus sp.]